MKIALMTDLFYPYLLGGGERQFYEIAKRLARRHDVHVFTLRTLPTELPNVHVHRFGAVHPMNGRSFFKLLSVPMMFPKVRGFDVVHVNQGISALYGMCEELSRRNGKIVATFHDLYINDWGRYYAFPSSLFGRVLEFLWVRMPYDDVIVPSASTQRKLKFFGVSSTIVPNGIDFEKYKIKRKEKTILYIGRLVKYKHVDDLIRAVRGLDYKLKIIGQGEEMESLTKLAKRLGVDAEFLGFVPEERKIDELARADIFVNPSMVEGFGIVILEALASGCKVVARPLPAYDFCEGNAIFDNDIRRGIERAMLWKVSRARLRGAARPFSWDNVVKQIERVYMRDKK